jgi:virulence-associated protein VapD
VQLTAVQIDGQIKDLQSTLHAMAERLRIDTLKQKVQHVQLLRIERALTSSP